MPTINFMKFKHLKLNLLLALILLPCSLLVSGCFTVVATGMVAGAVTVADRRTSGTVLEDQTIELKFIKRKGEMFPANKRISVSATSFNRTVLLTGWVPNDEVKNEIASLTAQIENVRNIENEINIGPPSTTSTFGKDALLTAKVKASFIEKKGLKANVVKVKTESGVVFLMGIVTDEEGAIAADISSRIIGTKRVVTLFEIVSKEDVIKLDSLSK